MIPSVQTFNEIRDEGLLGKLQRGVIEVLLQEPHPMTAGEVAARMGARQRNTVNPRMAELCRWGTVEKAGKRRCRISGRMSYTYRFTGRKPVKVKREAIECPMCRGRGSVTAAEIEVAVSRSRIQVVDEHGKIVQDLPPESDGCSIGRVPMDGDGREVAA